MDKWQYKETSIHNIKKMLNDYVIEVDSPDGYVLINQYVEKGKKNLFKLIVNNKELYCSGNHLIETDNGWILTKNLNNNHKILCDDNKFHSFILEKTNIERDVVDISVEHSNHRYYTNGISSHNTNMGKSLIKTALATNCLMQNKNVLYISLEMSETKISERILANLFDTELNDLNSIPKDRFINTFQKIKDALKHRLVVKDFPTRSANTNTIRNLLKELELKKKFKPDIIFLDYLGIMLPNSFNKINNSNTEMKIISEELRGLAMEQLLPIVSSIQTNRGGFGEMELDLTDVADSIGVTNTGDVIFAIAQSDEMRVAGRYLFRLVKNRYGINKVQCMVGVDYPKMRLYEVSDDNENSGQSESKAPTPTSHGKPQTPKGTESTTIVDESAVKILNTLKENKIANRKRMFGDNKKGDGNNNIKM